jgi:hypothetical protein
MDRLLTGLFVLALAGLVFWQLVTGKVLDRSWRPSVTRQDNPGMYWFIVIFQSALLMVILVTGTTSWNFP